MRTDVCVCGGGGSGGGEGRCGSGISKYMTAFAAEL